MRNTLFSMISQITGALFTVALTVFLVRALEPEDYGVLALAISIGTIVLLTSDVGISFSASRFAAESPHDRLHVAAVLRTSLGLKLIASTASAAAMVVSAPLVADLFGNSELTLPLRIMAIAVAAQGFGALFLGWFMAIGRVSTNVWYSLVESSVEATAAISIVLLGAGTAGAVAGRAIGFTVAGALIAVLAFRLVGWPAMRRASGPAFPARQIVGYGAALMIIDGVFAIFDRVDVLIIGGILDAGAAGRFEAATRVLQFLYYPAFAVSSGFAPRLAEGQRSDEDTARFMAALRYTILLYLLIAAPLLVWADPIVSVALGSDYGESAGVLRALSPTLLFAGLAPVLAVAANFLGEARRRVPLAIAALLVNIVIDLLLVSRIGIVAGAIGTGVAFAIYTGGHVLICQRALRISFAVLLPTVLRGLAATAIAALALFVFGTDHLNIFEWVGGTATAGLGYLAVLILLRELNFADLRAAGGLVVGAFRRRRETPATS
jgi:O-antigen/teichoic acid export membrane protein